MTIILESESKPRYPSLSTDLRIQNNDPTRVVPETKVSGCNTMEPTSLSTFQHPGCPSIGFAETMTKSPTLSLHVALEIISQV